MISVYNSIVYIIVCEREETEQSLSESAVMAESGVGVVGLCARETSVPSPYGCV